MTIKELKDYIADLPDDTTVGVWSWFADGERIYLPSAPLHPIERDGGYVVCIGTFDDCRAHRLIETTKEQLA